MSYQTCAIDRSLGQNWSDIVPGCLAVTRGERSINTPVHEDGGPLIFLLLHVEDVTGQIVRRQ